MIGPFESFTGHIKAAGLSVTQGEVNGNTAMLVIYRTQFQHLTMLQVVLTRVDEGRRMHIQVRSHNECAWISFPPIDTLPGAIERGARIVIGVYDVLVGGESHVRRVQRS